jgi:hypothetical protein
MNEVIPLKKRLQWLEKTYPGTWAQSEEKSDWNLKIIIVTTGLVCVLLVIAIGALNDIKSELETIQFNQSQK